MDSLAYPELQPDGSADPHELEVPSGDGDSVQTWIWRCGPEPDAQPPVEAASTARG